MGRIYFLLLILLIVISCSSPKSQNLKRQFSIQPIDINLPEKTFFCGERINLTDEDIHEKLDREILVNTFFQSATIQQLKRANRFFPVIERILKSKNIPTDFKYLAVIESGLLQVSSPAGALGFWQFMPQTAQQYGLKINSEVDERMDIEKSTVAACNYLLNANDTLKNWVLTAASYNRGIKGIQSDMKWQGTNNYFDTHLNSETGRYVYRILAIKMIFEHPDKFGFQKKKIKLYKPFRTKNVITSKSIENLAKWTIERGINYKILIKLNPWILSNKLTVNNDYFVLKLPQKDFKLKPYESYF
jgi:membrane-bound lytic murein transglycosylase D